MAARAAVLEENRSVRVSTGYPEDHARPLAENNGGLTFDMDYVHWVNEHRKLVNELRRARNSAMEDNELDVVVQSVIAHYDELFRLKSIGTKADVLHMLFGMWTTPAESCFMWLGGFQPSELVQILRKELDDEALTEQQVVELYNLKLSAMMAEDALSQGMEALQSSLSQILSSSTSTSSAEQVMEELAALNKLHNLEGFLHAADSLRQQSLRQLQRILTTRQAAGVFLLINDNISQLRNNLCRLDHQNHQEAKRKSQLGEKGILIAMEYPRDHNCDSVVANGGSAFDMEYERWMNEQQHVINNLRRAFNNSEMADNNDELHSAIVAVTLHQDELFRLKSIGTKSDVFHILSGAWKTPVERCFLWLGGLRSSHLLKIIMRDEQVVEALTEEQLVGLNNLERCLLQVEDALSQGMEALHQSLLESLSSTTLFGDQQMELAMTKLHGLESIIHQVDLLRQQTLEELQRMLSMRQVAKALLLIDDYISRLRNLKSATSPIIGSKL